MKTLVTAGVALIMAAGSALAADVGPVVAPNVFESPPAYATVRAYDWTGFYLGINGGGAFATTQWSSAPDALTGTSRLYGGFGGGTAGYYLQTPGLPYVLGVEGDVDWASIQGNLSPPSCLGGCTLKVSWLGTARLKFGWSFGALMPYATGGIAFGGLNGSIVGTPFGTQSANNLGWTAGAGIELAVSPAARIKVEYLFVNLATFQCFTACAGAAFGPISFNANNASIVRAGFTYRFWTN